MKLRRMLAALGCCLLLCGCTRAAGAPEDYTKFDTPFELTADFTRGSLTGSFLYTRSSPELCELRYFAPQTLSGMCVREEAGQVTTELAGLVHRQTRAAIKNGSPIRALGRALDAFKSEQPAGCVLENGEVEYTLSYGARIVTSGGQLRRIECPQEELTITVTGFTALA